ncbi:hypothetical protein CEXT_97221 [Caerostris extrusa]|uniref:Uncharacterized protein n=1 Tax=Caerostris extrusa TaxID=172846 RepID=A0AAV4NB69_CAEEX|nr:hypothetical protein CEXT_97221 [Caerostris extrusa]
MEMTLHKKLASFHDADVTMETVSDVSGESLRKCLCEGGVGKSVYRWFPSGWHCSKRQEELSRLRDRRTMFVRSLVPKVDGIASKRQGKDEEHLRNDIGNVLFEQMRLSVITFIQCFDVAAYKCREPLRCPGKCLGSPAQFMPLPRHAFIFIVWLSKHFYFRRYGRSLTLIGYGYLEELRNV